MSDVSRNDFMSYEYKEIIIASDKASFYLDCYESFGWKLDKEFPPKEAGNKITLKLKRDRKLVNRTELTRLQRHFESNMEEIASLESSKSRAAQIWALSVGIIGTVFMAGAVFAVTADPPRIALCVVLAIPAFAGWIAPYFVYRTLKEKKTQQVTLFIEEKMEETYTLCEKGQQLL